MTTEERNRQPKNSEFTDTVIWEELTNELSSYAANDTATTGTAETIEIASLLTDEETDSLLTQGKQSSTKK